jgi:DNA-binding transcriptional regulator YbjK
MDFSGTSVLTSGVAASRSRSTPARRQRGERRRRAILEAALRVIGRDGVAGLTHRAVAEEAGVPLAATTYYFASKADVLREAAELAIERADADTGVPAAPRPARPERLAAALATLLAGTDPAERLVQHEIGLEAARSPALRGLVFSWAERERVQLRPWLAAAGSRDPAGDARIVQSAMLGIELEALTRGARVDARAARRQLGRLLRALIGARAR